MIEINSKKLERTSKFVNYSVSSILCIFLILFSSKIIEDLDSTTDQPMVEDYENKALLDKENAKIEKIFLSKETVQSQIQLLEKTLEAAKEKSISEKKSFDNWVQTRATLGAPDKDKEVTEKVLNLDKLYQIEQEWKTKLAEKKSLFDSLEKQETQSQKIINKEKDAAINKYNENYKYYELKVFLIRLLFVSPVLILGIYFFVKFRKHKFWPLYFGFTLFSLYAFFFGLVPYLPSYGGYIRYATGVVLSIGLGYYAIKTIRQYVEQKQAELKISTQERAKNVPTEVAEKALENHFCPSCGKDFLLKKWDKPLKNSETEIYKFVTNYCRHCGLQLFKNCTVCDYKNFAHLPFCSSCGHKPEIETIKS